MNVNHFTQKYIDWVVKLGRLKFSILGFLIVAVFALLTHIVLSLLVVGRIDWQSLAYAIIFWSNLRTFCHLLFYLISGSP